MSREESHDAEELREVLKAVSEFLKDIKEPLGELLKTMIESVSGEKLAREVSTFYKSLVENGLDPQTAKEWTEKFLDERLKSLPSLSFLKDLMSERPRTVARRKGEEYIVEKEEEE
ncbi:MAG: hypothetical protein QXM76_01980 [Zestosphaera sp.]